MSSEFKQYHFVVACPWCGRVNHGEVPIPAKNSDAVSFCKGCNKTLIEFHEAEE